MATVTLAAVFVVRWRRDGRGRAQERVPGVIDCCGLRVGSGGADDSSVVILSVVNDNNKPNDDNGGGGLEGV